MVAWIGPLARSSPWPHAGPRVSCAWLALACLALCPTTTHAGQKTRGGGRVDASRAGDLIDRLSRAVPFAWKLEASVEEDRDGWARCVARVGIDAMMGAQIVVRGPVERGLLLPQLAVMRTGTRRKSCVWVGARPPLCMGGSQR